MIPCFIDVVYKAQKKNQERQRLGKRRKELVLLKRQSLTPLKPIEGIFFFSITLIYSFILNKQNLGYVLCCVSKGVNDLVEAWTTVTNAIFVIVVAVKTRQVIGQAELPYSFIVFLL